ncbi:MAG: VPLPA-CTERM sorting domain-containing protein [Pseudomonadota bacterium]|nr:VPLPA-CTERM sorting domain-containing protein [Pseudomonadota bacterium]
MRFFAVLGTLALLSGGAVQAASVVETVDFSNSFFSPTNFGEFGVGDNTVTGSVSATCVLDPGADFSDCSGGDEIDYGFFTLAAGTELVGASVVISNFTTDAMYNYPVDPNFPAETGPIEDPSAIGGGVNNVYFEENGVFSLLGDSFLAGGVISVQIFPSTILGFGNNPDIQSFGTVSFDYQVTVSLRETTPAVPLPAGFSLFLTGLAGLYGVARKSKRQDTKAA